jgi:hypothetical protein
MVASLVVIKTWCLTDEGLYPLTNRSYNGEDKRIEDGGWKMEDGR